MPLSWGGFTTRMSFSMKLAIGQTHTMSVVGGVIPLASNNAIRMMRQEGKRGSKMVQTSYKNDQNGYALHEQEWQHDYFRVKCVGSAHPQYVASKNAFSPTEHRAVHVHAVL